MSEQMQEQTKERELDFELLKDNLQERYHLIYVDYRDDLSDVLDKVQESIQAGAKDALYEATDEWYSDTYDAEEDALRDLRDSVVRLGYDRDVVEQAIDDNRDELRCEIQDRDHSTPIADLIRNTPDQAVFFPILDDYIEESYTESAFKHQVKRVKKVLKIPYSNKQYDRKIEGMVADAGYGGQLVVYFHADIGDLLDIDPKMNRVEFSDPVIAIIDLMNGSGGDCELKGWKFTKPFNRANLFIDKTIKYNYTHEVCGMSDDWCSSTSFKFYKGYNRSQVKKSRIHAGLDMEAEYEKAFKAGSCTFGDMDMRRHRGTFYLNEFPCGTHCPHCGTFWID